MRLPTALLALCAVLPLGAEITGGCACDVTRPETLEPIQCGLCRVAETQPGEPAIFLIKDHSPRKPNRWLALPRSHAEGYHELSTLTPRQRVELWSVAIAKAKSLWGDEWGLAMNGPANRTQCHAHIHIGKLLKGAENHRFVVVDGPAQIPIPTDGKGLWVHPYGLRLHVHLGESATETVLLR